MAKETQKPGVPSASSSSQTSSAKAGKPSVDPIHGVAEELQSIRDRDVLQEGMLSFVEFLEKNKGLAIGVVTVAILVGVGVVGWDLISERKEKNAQEAFYAIEKDYTAKREKYDQAKFATLTGGKIEEMIKAGTAIRASGDLTKDYGTLVEDLEAFASKNKGTTAAVQASLIAAETRLQYKQAEQALQTLETSVSSTKANSLVGVLARMAAGNAQAAAGKCDQALKSWEQVLAAKDFRFLHSEAALRAGLCLEKAGDKAKAIEMYRKASSESEKSTAAQTARSLLRALELGT